jgi:hypothetical protein
MLLDADRLSQVWNHFDTLKPWGNGGARGEVIEDAFAAVHSGHIHAVR